jgi:hypothetical protein
MKSVNDTVSKPLRVRFVCFLLRRFAMRNKVFCWWDEDRCGWNVNTVIR